MTRGRRIWRPTNLQEINSSGRCELSNRALTGLSPEIGQLINLRTLILDANYLTKLPPEIGQLTILWKLTLDRNELTALPPEIGQLTNLGTLTLDRNRAYRAASRDRSAHQPPNAMAR